MESVELPILSKSSILHQIGEAIMDLFFGTLLAVLLILFTTSPLLYEVYKLPTGVILFQK